LAQGRPDEARTVIDQALPYCDDNGGRTFLQSLSYGSIGRSLKIVPPPPPWVSVSVEGLHVVSAVWGSGTQFTDVTDRVKDALDQPDADFPVTPGWLKSDPSVGWKKALIVILELRGKRFIFTSPENAEFGVRTLKKFLAGQKL